MPSGFVMSDESREDEGELNPTGGVHQKLSGRSSDQNR